MSAASGAAFPPGGQAAWPATARPRYEGGPGTGPTEPLLVTFDFSGAAMPAGATLTRASSGTRFNASGVMVIEPADTPRFDHRFDGSAWVLAGLLVEPQRTNLVLQSENFASWTLGRTVVLANVSSPLAPDGSATADSLQEDNTTGGHNITSAVISLPPVSCWAQSIYCYPSECARVDFILPVPGTFNTYEARVDLAANTIASIGSLSPPTALQIVNYDGWRHIQLVGVPLGGTANRAPKLEMRNGAGADTYTGDNVARLHLWGAQLEAGEFVTSYIPTSSSSTIREAEGLALEIPTGLWDLQAVSPNGSFLANNTSVDGGTSYVFHWSDFSGAASERHLLSLTALRL